MYKKTYLMKRITLTLALIVIWAASHAQSPVDENTTIINGFQEKISGYDFSYYSSIKAAKEGMLIRASDERSFMEWETAPVPEGIDTEYSSFIWLAGLGPSHGVAAFDLHLNGENIFTFKVDGSDEWTLSASDGSSLSFKNDMTDQFGDKFGFMQLTLPTRQLTPGKPVQIKISGQNFDKTTWYITYKFPLEPGLQFKALPAITNLDGHDHQLAVAGIFWPGKPTTAKFFIDDKLVTEAPVAFGYNHTRVILPAVQQPLAMNYLLQIDDQSWSGQIELQPVRKWKVNFVHHSHTDIGYTRSQTDILGDHLRYIDYALDYCDNTDHHPHDSQFRWTCEAAWAVDEYLRSRPQQQVERLMQRINEGRIEVTGMYFNFNELPDEQILAASLQPLARFHERGIVVKTAMQNDVNGFAWSLLDHYTELGVKYVNMGTHGHRALISFDKPTLFWWESPSGNRMLTYRGEHYMIGNVVFKIHAGDFNVFEEELLTYLATLEDKGYRYDLISIQHSGFITDNSPPSIAPAQMIKQWNEKYSWPKLETATATAFFEEMEQKYGETFPVIRGAWPDWWTDGFGASTREVAATRHAQSDLIANMGGLTMASMMGFAMPDQITNRMETINSALLFYTEHTVGYSESVRQPFHKHTMEQRAIKESYAWEASRRARMLGEETLGLLQSNFKREEKPSIIVFNTLNWKRSGMFVTYIDHQIIPRNARFTITDIEGNTAKAQVIESHSDGAYWAIWVDNIPAFGYKKFTISVDHDIQPVVISHHQPDVSITENQWYRIVTDLERGAITSLIDKELNLELIDRNAEWKMGEFIREMLNNRSEMEQLYLANYTREPLQKVWLEAYKEGQIWNTLHFKGNTPAAIGDGDYDFEIRIFNTTKRIDLAYHIEKSMITDPEGIYNAFPFNLTGGQISFDVQGGEIRAGIDQIPGSVNDWNTVQNYARVHNSNSQIIISSAEIPLMQFGAINTGRYTAEATPETTHIYGWPLNNYWVTNFNAEQRGGMEWNYAITSQRNTSSLDAVKFGWGHRTPFLARVVPGGGPGDSNQSGSLITNWPQNILLISATPAQDGRSALLHIRETNGQPASLELLNGITQQPLPTTPADVTGRSRPDLPTTIKPYEGRFFRIQLD
jgi:alpha-mannosidase